MTLTWTKQPLTREVARELRAATRKNPGRDGHRFSYHDLKELYSAPGHLVLTHDTDTTWQHWVQEGGRWILQGWHDTRELAQQAAEAECPPTGSGGESGLWVIARKENGRLIRVRSQTQDPKGLQAIFERLGYETRTEVVA